jgi:hypothetical protein
MEQYGSVECASGVQQPCSNLGKYPENSGKASRKEYPDLQGFCKL